MALLGKSQRVTDDQLFGLLGSMGAGMLKSNNTGRFGDAWAGGLLAANAAGGKITEQRAELAKEQAERERETQKARAQYRMQQMNTMQQAQAKNAAIDQENARRQALGLPLLPRVAEPQFTPYADFMSDDWKPNAGSTQNSMPAGGPGGQMPSNMPQAGAQQTASGTPSGMGSAGQSTARMTPQQAQQVLNNPAANPALTREALNYAYQANEFSGVNINTKLAEKYFENQLPEREKPKNYSPITLVGPDGDNVTLDAATDQTQIRRLVNNGYVERNPNAAEDPLAAALAEAEAGQITTASENSEMIGSKMRNLEDTIDAFSQIEGSGPVTDFMNPLKAAAVDVGIIDDPDEIKEIADFEKFQAVTMKNARDLHDQGVMTDADFRNYQKMTAGGLKTMEGNRALLNMQMRILQREKMYNDMKRQYAREKGTLEGYDDWFRDNYVTDMFTEETFNKFPALADDYSTDLGMRVSRMGPAEMDQLLNNTRKFSNLPRETQNAIIKRAEELDKRGN